MKKTITLATAFFCFLSLTNAQDGDPDKSFGINGIVKTRYSDTTAYKSSAAQADGKLVVAGNTWNGRNYDFLVVRYNIDGSLDNTFDVDGKHKTDFGGTNDMGLCVAIQSDGKIVVAGSSNHRFALARYNTDGSLDNTFSGDGKQIDNFHGNSDGARSVAIQSDGKIVVAGVAKDSFAVACYTSSGSLDKSFSGDGLQTTGFGNRYSYNEYANAAVIQNDGKIVVAGTAEDQFVIARYNTDGSPDLSFSSDGKEKTVVSDVFASASSLALQKDGKIVVEGEIASEETNAGFAIVRYKTDGSLDSTFSYKGIYEDFSFNFINSIALQDDGKIVGGGSVQGSGDGAGNFSVFRFNSNGKPDSSFSADGVQTTDINGAGFYGIASITISKNKLFAAGTSSDSGYSGIAARYMLDNSNKAPSVSISIPNNTLVYTAPARIKINATAYDENGTIQKVEFYNGNTLIHTENVFPYGFLWKNVPVGEYTLTAKAYDNDGFATTSNAINVSVVYNQFPVVKIVSPTYDTTYTAPAAIRLIAQANDPDGQISNVKFFAENIQTRKDTLLRTEYHYPYTYTWNNVQAGNYIIYAEAEDNKGYKSRYYSEVRVTDSTAITVSAKPYHENKKALSKDAVILRLSPNPATNILNIYAGGLQQDKPATISIISVSGIVLKTVNIKGSNQTIPIDVSSLARGAYIVKIISGYKIFNKQFVKL